MRIALCIECPIRQHGGVEILVRALIDGLAGEHEVFLVSDDDTATLMLTDIGGKLAGHRCWCSGSIRREDCVELADWLVAQGVDVVHFHLGGTYSWNSRSLFACPITIAAARGLCCVATNHGAFGFWLYVGAQRSLVYRLLALPICWLGKLRQVASVRWEATVSRHDCAAVKRWFFPYRGRFLQMYHSILDESTLPALPKREIILCLGTVGVRKGQPYLVEAFAKIADRFPSWQLVIAGRHAADGTGDIMMLAIHRHGLKDRVEVMTDVSDAQARDMLASAAVFAMPSLAEGLGLSLQEAMFGRAACVGSQVGGIPDLIVPETTGLLVPPADPDGLADALERLLSDTDMRGRMGEAGRAHIIRNGMTKRGMIAQHVKLYHDLAGR